MRIAIPIPQQGGPRIPQNPIFLKNGKKSLNTQKLKNVQKYAKISDTPFDQRSLSIGKRGFRVDQEHPKTQIFLKTEKIIQNAKTQKCLEICQNQRYALQPEVSNTSGSVVSTMFCKAKSAKKKICAAILDHFQTKFFKCQTNSFHYFSLRIPNL